MEVGVYPNPLPKNSALRLSSNIKAGSSNDSAPGVQIRLHERDLWSVCTGGVRQCDLIYKDKDEAANRRRPALPMA